MTYQDNILINSYLSWYPEQKEASSKLCPFKLHQNFLFLVIHVQKVSDFSNCLITVVNNL